MKICPACHLSYHGERATCFVDGSELQVVEDERIGTVLAGRYVLEGLLGEGGMATVYRARHNLVDRPCAVKVLHPELSKDATLRERLRREARSAAAIRHPNVVEIFDFGETPTGEPYLVMELLEGMSLRELVGEPMALDQVVELGGQVAAGLARAHDLGVVHRDLKPENIFVVEVEQPDGTKAPQVKLVDFGLATVRRETRLTATGEIVGTPAYMAPERFKTSEVTPAADLYAMGILLFEMVTGRLPFESENIAGFVIAHLEDAPPRASTLASGVPAELDVLIEDLLRKRPEQRPVDAHQVLERLQRVRPSRARTELRITSRASLPRVLVTIDRWADRLSLYEEMLARAYPAGPPRQMEELLAEMRAALGRLRALRERAMQDQRELEELEADNAASRERLGHAIHVLGVDLSTARADAREVAQHLDEHGSAVRSQSEGWRAADAQLARLRADPDATPGDAELGAARRATGALAAWHAAQAAYDLDDARRFAIEDRERDLTFQAEALRERAERVESELDAKAEDDRARLTKNGVERRQIEMRILYLASKLSAPLRERPELRELFDRVGAA